MSGKENIKCFIYSSLKDNQTKIAEFCNPSQKEFLMYQANSLIRKVGKKETKLLQSQPSSNGFWYYKVNADNIQLILTTKDTHQNVVNMFFGKVAGFIARTNFDDPESINKLKFNVNDSLKLFNANSMSKLQSLNDNVEELQGMMRNNVGTIVKNMGDLEVVEKKSSIMSELSMSLENDSKALEKKMKRRQFCIRMVCLGLILVVGGLVVYFVFG